MEGGADEQIYESTAPPSDWMTRMASKGVS
jgi:hypothetical protein